MTPTLTAFSPSTGPTLPGMEMCETLVSTTLNPLTSSVEDSPVQMLVSPDLGKDSLGNGQLYGPNSLESFARLAPDGRWLKTYRGYSQQTMDGSLERCSGTWPSAGTMRNGKCYRQRSLERRTFDGESSLLPTPTVIDASGGRINKSYGRHAKERPTLAKLVGRLINPAWVEHLMGFPPDWSDLEDSVTQ